MPEVVFPNRKDYKLYWQFVRDLYTVCKGQPSSMWVQAFQHEGHDLPDIEEFMAWWKHHRAVFWPMLVTEIINYKAEHPDFDVPISIVSKMVQNDRGYNRNEGVSYTTEFQTFLSRIWAGNYPDRADWFGYMTPFDREKRKMLQILKDDFLEAGKAACKYLKAKKSPPGDVTRRFTEAYDALEDYEKTT
jgi:hypothetical protein